MLSCLIHFIHQFNPKSCHGYSVRAIFFYDLFAWFIYLFHSSSFPFAVMHSISSSKRLARWNIEAHRYLSLWIIEYGLCCCVSMLYELNSQKSSTKKKYSPYRTCTRNQERERERVIKVSMHRGKREIRARSLDPCSSSGRFRFIPSTTSVHNPSANVHHIISIRIDVYTQ